MRNERDCFKSGANDSARDRGDYHRRYYRTYRSPLPMSPNENFAEPRANGPPPRISRARYDALVECKRASKASRPKLWDLADQWGETPWYLARVWRSGIARYDLERHREFVALLCECIDEAREQQ